MKRFAVLLLAFVFLFSPVFAEDAPVPATANKVEGPVTGALPDVIPLAVRNPHGSPVDNLDGVSIYFCSQHTVNGGTWTLGGVISQPRTECTAPDRHLHLQGKRQVTGISLTPAMPGEWRWTDDYTLTFTPARPWPPGQDYAVEVSPSVFPPQVALQSKAYDFSARPLRADINSMEFFQDPNEVEKRGIATSITFNAPVSADEVKKHVSFSIGEVEDAKNPAKGKFVTSATGLPFDVVMNDDGLQAAVTTPITTMPDKERFLQATVSPGLVSTAGGSPLATGTSSGKREDRARIPSRYDYAAFTSVEASIVKNEDYTPEQIVAVESNVPVTGAELARHLKIQVLPKDKPSSTPGRRPEEDYAWTSASEVTDEILAEAPEVKFALKEPENDAVTLHGLKIDAEPGRWLYVRITKDLPLAGGYILSADSDNTVQAPEYTQEVRILSSGALLSLSGEKKISLYSLGAEKLRFRVGRVMNDDVAHLVSQSGGSFQNPYFQNYNFDQSNITESFTKDLDLLSPDLRKPQFSAFDFTPYLAMTAEGGKAAPRGKGLFFFTAEALKKDAEGNEQVVSTDRRFVLVSDLGFAVKTGADASHDIFVQSISTGAPVEGARIDVLGLNGLSIVKAVTDAQGHAALPALTGFSAEKRPVAYIVRTGGDMSFMPYDRRDRTLNYSSFDTGGESGADDELRAYLFSDRGIYRPGETVHIGMLVKQGDWMKNLAGVPLQMEISNPRGQVIDKPVVKMSAEGAAEYSFDTRDTSPTGVYNVRLFITDDGKRGAQLGSTSVRVEEFLPDTLKIASKFNKPETKGWLTPENLKAEVQLDHLYGAPAVDHRVKASLGVVPGSFHFKDYEDFSFYDAAQSEKSFDQPIGEAQTDEKGQAEFDLSLSQFGNSTYRLTFNAEGFVQNSGRSVRSASSVLVSPLPYVIGMKSSSNLGYINKGDKRTIELIAVNPDLKTVPVTGLTAQVLQITYVSSLIRTEEGGYEYRSTAREAPVKSEKLEIPEEGAEYAPDTATPGSYALVIADGKGTVLQRIPYTVVGEGNFMGRARKDAAITVRLDKQAYAAGDTISMNIVSPYTGTGLITIETNKVLAFKWFKSKTTSSVQTISLPKNFTGKGFVNVQFVRALDSKEVYTAPLAYSVQPFMVDTAAIDSGIQLDVPGLVKPGDEISIGYKAKNPGKIFIFAVDEGILQYAHYKTPDPLDFFVNRRALQVDTAQILDLLMPEYSLLRSATGGDTGLGDGKNLNPFKRKTQPPVAFWSGILDADQKQREVHFKVPEYFNGSLRVMAVAVSGRDMGAAEAKTNVKGDLIISPNVPLFAAPGDEFVVGLALANNIAGSGKNATVHLSVKPSEQLEIVEGGEQDLTVPEDGETKGSLRVKAKDMPGGASLVFNAAAQGKSASYEMTLSVRPPLPSMTALLSGYAEQGEKTVKQDRDIYKEFATADASVSTLPVSLVPGLSEYLERFPYGCTEQVVSKAFPAVTLYGQKDLGGDTKIVEDSVKHAMLRLRELQSSSGGFGYWWYGGNADDFVSIYALHYMTLAQEKHLPVPDDTFRRAQDYVRNLVSRRPTTMEEARNVAYGIYVLTRGGIVTSNYLPPLLSYLDTDQKDKWKQDLTAVYIASSYKLMQLTPEAEELMKDFALGDPVYWKMHDYYYSESAFYNSINRYAQYLSLMSDHFPEMLPGLDRNVLFRLANFIGEGAYNTLSSSYAIMAFSDYGRASTDQTSAQLSIAQDGRSLPLTGDVIRHAQLEPKQSDVQFGGGGSYGLFYQIATDGYDRARPDHPVEDGLEISRQYLDDKHQPVTEVKVGDSIDVVVRMRAHDEKTLQNMALVDLLPGGFETVPESISRPATSESTETPIPAEDTSWLKAPLWPVEAVDAREDRVLAFGAVPDSEVVYRYRVKAVNAGSYATPPAYIESMYDRAVKARGVAGTITVK